MALNRHQSAWESNIRESAQKSPESSMYYPSRFIKCSRVHSVQVTIPAASASASATVTLKSNRTLRIPLFLSFPNTHRKMSIIPHIFGRRSNVYDPFSLDVWDPFEGLPFGGSFRSLSDRLRSGFPSETASFAHASIDWKETPTAHVFKADVPGLKKEEVKVEVEDGRVLHISGERNREQEEKTDTWHRVERSSGKFVRRFRLPENAKVDQVKAAMDNGVLTVTVPKEEVKKADVKSIEISG